MSKFEKGDRVIEKGTEDQYEIVDYSYNVGGFNVYVCRQIKGITWKMTPGSKGMFIRFREDYLEMDIQYHREKRLKKILDGAERRI